MDRGIYINSYSDARILVDGNNAGLRHSEEPFSPVVLMDKAPRAR